MKACVVTDLRKPCDTSCHLDNNFTHVALQCGPQVKSLNSNDNPPKGNLGYLRIFTKSHVKEDQELVIKWHMGSLIESTNLTIPMMRLVKLSSQLERCILIWGFYDG